MYRAFEPQEMFGCDFIYILCLNNDLGAMHL